MAVANAHAYEEEKRRNEALAEIDRAKTAFFSNVSHEFRTPLTLMLGPLEDLLVRSSAFPPADQNVLAIVHRNGERLLKLVNSLLDFSRIEAGRMQATYEPTDLAALTADLASVFRSACEKEGLELGIDCAPLSEPVYIDQEMWEKIVLNLLSNAFKFTFAGGISVVLKAVEGVVELSVRDTGTGIPANEVAQVFERFHRVEGARGRTHEGTGIGLALVQELAKLHGGGCAGLKVSKGKAVPSLCRFLLDRLICQANASTLEHRLRPPSGQSRMSKRHCAGCQAVPPLEVFRWRPSPRRLANSCPLLLPLPGRCHQARARVPACCLPMTMPTCGTISSACSKAATRLKR